MSRRCLSSSFRFLSFQNTSSSTPSHFHRVKGARRYVQAALKTRVTDTDVNTSERFRQSPPHPQFGLRSRKGDGEANTGTTVFADEDDFDSRGMAALSTGTTSDSAATETQEHSRDTEQDTTSQSEPHLHASEGSQSFVAPDPQFAEHLNGLFSPLQFPPELARRILTHGSHPAAIHGHNAGLSFMGRRVLESYLLLMLTSSPSLLPSHDLDLIISRTLNTYVLGEHVGTQWGLGRALRWTPTVSALTLKREGGVEKIQKRALMRNVGLYKVQGDAVAAVMGGIFYQFGASVAHRVFHTRLLPNILLERRPEGLHDAFHQEALEVCQKMGGTEGHLLLEPAGSTSSDAGATEKVAATL